MPAYDYIPATDEGFETWATHFVEVLSLDPANYMLTAGQVATVQGAVDDFVAKLFIATGESTRTKPTIIAKDDARVVAETLCRQYAMLIKDNAGIPDNDKIAAGVRPVNVNRERIDCPQTSPLLNILGNTPGTQTIRFADSTTPDSPAKPFGATELQLFLAVGTTAATDPSQAKFIGKYTRKPIDVDFGEPDDAKQATYFARWASRRGETGPWSIPVTFTIAA